MKQVIWLLVLGGIARAACAQPVWINELVTDAGTRVLTTGTDEGEFIELVGPAGYSLKDFTLTITDCGDASYNYTIGSFAFSDDGNMTDDGFGFFVLSDLTGAGDQFLANNGSMTFGEDSEHLPDGSGAVLLKDAGGGTVFEYAYGACLTFTNRGAPDALSPGISVGFLVASKPDDEEDGSELVSTPGSENGGQNLPVELTSFEAISSGLEVELRWETASEANNAGFEIQRISKWVETQHAASSVWETIDFVEGQGTTERAQVYSYRVGELAPGAYRFRLKQIDYDGTFAYSPTVEVALGMPEAYLVSAAYPNPFNPRTQFSVSVVRRQHVAVQVVDLTGRQVASLFSGTLEANQARSIVFEPSELPSGLYLLRTTGEHFTTSQMVMLLK